MRVLSVIYQIRNIDNNKIYVGSAINFIKRKHAHLTLLRKGTHHSQYLQNAWIKYGESKFIFEVLEIVDNVDMLLEREQLYLDKKPEYNMCPIAHSQLGFRWTEEQKQKKKGVNHHNYGKPAYFKGHIHSNESKELNRLAHIGKVHTSETILKMRNSKLGKPGRKHSTNTKIKISKSKMGSIPVNKIQVKQFKNDILIKTWDSIADAATTLNICKTSISKCCRKITKSAGNYIWKYANS